MCAASCSYCASCLSSARATCCACRLTQTHLSSHPNTGLGEEVSDEDLIQLQAMILNGLNIADHDLPPSLQRRFQQHLATLTSQDIAWTPWWLQPVLSEPGLQAEPRDAPAISADQLVSVAHAACVSRLAKELRELASPPPMPSDTGHDDAALARVSPSVIYHVLDVLLGYCAALAAVAGDSGDEEHMDTLWVVMCHVSAVFRSETARPSSVPEVLRSATVALASLMAATGHACIMPVSLESEYTVPGVIRMCVLLLERGSAAPGRALWHVAAWCEAAGHIRATKKFRFLAAWARQAVTPRQWRDVAQAMQHHTGAEVIMPSPDSGNAPAGAADLAQGESHSLRAPPALKATTDVDALD